jgi:acetaldehyde dehydrogenase (acetylating)
MNNPVELKAEEKVAAVKLLVSGYQLVKQNQFDRFDRTNEYF